MGPLTMPETEEAQRGKRRGGGARVDGCFEPPKMESAELGCKGRGGGREGLAGGGSCAREALRATAMAISCRGCLAARAIYFCLLLGPAGAATILPYCILWKGKGTKGEGFS